MLFWFGLAIGALLTVPLAAIAAGRWARRMRRLEQRARTTQRLAELGTLTGGLAHEIKNPLSTVSLNLQLLQEDLKNLTTVGGVAGVDSETSRSGDADDAAPNTATQSTGSAPPPTPGGTASPLEDPRLGRITRRFESLSREMDRLRNILEDFLRFAGRVKLERRPINVNELINELADFFLPQAQTNGVHLRTQFDAPNATLSVDAAMLKQALLNLMINACHAMAKARQARQPSGGNDELIIRTQRVRAISGGGDFQIHVIDTGPGIDDQEKERIFQPYFSGTKGGTGLGLPTARRIVEEHGGTITCYSETGRGTDFVISLPYDE